jgi:4-amino-4-deoxy-L-arabinose transferase-like glycosyltransferase
MAAHLRRVRFTVGSALILLLLAYPLFFQGLAERDLWSSHEARAAQNARMMLETGQWGLPRLLDGTRELQKPPLFYWLVAGLAWLRGGDVDAWAVRLPSAVAALLCVLALWAFGRRRRRPVAGFLAGLVLATMVHFTWTARVGRIDIPLSLLVAGMLIGYYLGRQALRDGRTGIPWLLMAYVASGVSVLLKGPVGLVLAGAVVLAHLALERELTAGMEVSWRRIPGNGLRRLHVLGLWWGVPVVLAIALPWFLWANQETHGEFFRVFFVRHNLERGLGGDEQFESHFHPWWFYAYRLAIDLQPWSVFLAIAAWFLWRRRLWREDCEARFGLIWLLTMTLVLTALEYKRADYLLPAYPGAALLLGCIGERWLLALGSWQRRVGIVAAGALTAACVIGWLVYVELYLPRREPERDFRRFAECVRQHVPPPGHVILFRVEAHPLVYHLGRPVDRIWEWENLDIWACQPAPLYVVMPESEAERWPQHLEAGRLYPVVSNSQLAGTLHTEPLVLLCTRPGQ